MSFTIEVSSPWFEYIREGKKNVEGRKGTPRWSAIKPGMKGLIKHSLNEEYFEVECMAIRKYNDLYSYLTEETTQEVLPGINSVEEGIQIYLQWSTPEEVAQFGFLAIELRVI